jgi:transformation/transcription domain-associated protein
MAPSDPVTQMNTYRSYVTMLADPNAKDESKLKAAQEMSENFEVKAIIYVILCI